MLGIKNVIGALAIFASTISNVAYADFFDISGDIFDITIETSGTDVIDVTGIFETRNVTGLSTFNFTNNEFISATDFDFSFLVNPSYNGGGLPASVLPGDSVNIIATGTEYQYLIGSQADNNVRFPGVGTATLSGVTVVDAVPEPQSYAMFLAGLALLGFVSRRRA